MASVEIKTTITFQDLLNGVEQLELNDLEEFLEKVLKLRAKKVVPSLSKKETELLEIINQGISKMLNKRFQELDEKRKSETLKPVEHRELIKLVTEIESANVHRINALVELANIRQTSLKDLMKQLDIQAPRGNG